MSKNGAAPDGGAGTSSPKTSINSAAAVGKNKSQKLQVVEPPNPTDNWRETDKKMIEDIQIDRNKAGAKKAGKSKSQNDVKKGKEIAAGGFAIALVEIEIPDLVVVIDASASAPNLGNSGIVAGPHKAFDPSILDDPDVLELTLPPKDQPNYVQCPHCGKRFEPLVAAPRHIPQCKEYYFNLAEKEKFAATKKKK